MSGVPDTFEVVSVSDECFDTNIRSKNDCVKQKDVSSDENMLPPVPDKSCIAGDDIPENFSWTRAHSYEEMKKQPINVKNLLVDFNGEICIEEKCNRILSLAVTCLNELSEKDLSSILEVLSSLNSINQPNDLVICEALLLLSLPRNALSLEQLPVLEKIIVKVANSVVTDASFSSQAHEMKLLSLGRQYSRNALRLCQELLSEKTLDLCNVDVLTICCSSLRNFLNNKLGSNYQYNEQTFKFILGMIGKATQEIISESLIEEEENDVLSASFYMVDQCLTVFEHILSEDRYSQRKTLNHEDFSLLHCLTRLLGWCVSVIFNKEQDSSSLLTLDDALSKFYLSTLLSILKILSILSFNPDQYNNFTNIKGLMERVMMCILKASFWSENNHFDILILALELMINFYLKNKKTFVLLCLKKFKASEDEIMSIEALLKVLTTSIGKINEIQPRVLAENARVEKANEATGATAPESTDENCEEAADLTLDFVLEAADEDMMLSTIVAFVSVLVVFFMDTKESFVNFVKERLCPEKSREAVTISKKFIQFALITGSMPASGIVILQHSIKKLNELHPNV